MKKTLIVLFLTVCTLGILPAQIKVVLENDIPKTSVKKANQTPTVRTRTAKRQAVADQEKDAPDSVSVQKQREPEQKPALEKSKVPVASTVVKTEPQKKQDEEKPAKIEENQGNSRADYVKRLRERQKRAKDRNSNAPTADDSDELSVLENSAAVDNSADLAALPEMTPRERKKMEKEQKKNRSSVLMEDDLEKYTSKKKTAKREPTMSLPMVMVGEAKFQNDLSSLGVDKNELNYLLPDKKAQFSQGGDKGLVQFFLRSVNYPNELKAQGVKDDLTVRFVVDKTGKAKNGEVVNADSPEMAKEVLRVVDILPEFQPALFKGHEIDTKVEMDITFRILNL